MYLNRGRAGYNRWFRKVKPKVLQPPRKVTPEEKEYYEQRIERALKYLDKPKYCGC